MADLSQLKETCEKVLIAAHSDLMWDEFQSLLDGDRSDGKHAHWLGEMCPLIIRIRSHADVWPLDADTEWSGAAAEKVRGARQEGGLGGCAKGTACAWSGQRGGQGGVTRM